MNNSDKHGGASKLSSAVDSGNGGEAAETNGNVPMVESSETSVPSGKPSTKRGAKLSKAQALEILQQSVLNCQHADIEIWVTPLYINGTRTVAIILDNVQVFDGNLIADIGNGVP